MAEEGLLCWRKVSNAKAHSIRQAFCRTRLRSPPHPHIIKPPYRGLYNMAEEGGFEPPMGVNPCRISSAVQSTTLPLLRALPYFSSLRRYPAVSAYSHISICCVRLALAALQDQKIRVAFYKRLKTRGRWLYKARPSYWQPWRSARKPAVPAPLRPPASSFSRSGCKTRRSRAALAC